MGCKQSTLSHTVSVTPSDSIDHFLWGLIDIHGYFSESEYKLPPLLENLKISIKKHWPIENETIALAYFRNLSRRADAYQLFNTAASIIIRMDKPWLLNEDSLTFFNELSLRNRALSDSLLGKLNQLCIEDSLGLNNNHIDTVVASILKLQNVPEDPFAVLDAAPDVRGLIKDLRQQHGPELRKTAHRNQLIHHDIPHALEIRLRTLHILINKMNLFMESRSGNDFLKTLIGFMIEFHDWVQGDKGSFKSVELATAQHVIEWLIEALNLEVDHGLKKIIEFIADQIIVLGTTMIFSPNHTMDLSQLYFMFKDKAIESGIYRTIMPSQAFTQMIEKSMLITGVIDKNPTAMPDVVEFQFSDRKVASFPILKEYFPTALILERFFYHEGFTPYSDHPRPITDYDKQCFLINLVPHLAMRAELGIKSKFKEVSEAAKSYILFISLSRRHLLTTTDSIFTSHYLEEFRNRTIDKVINTLFFSDAAIAGEVSFSRSQTRCLEFVKHRLQLLAPPDRTDDYGRLVDPNVPNIDALNFRAIKVFYDALDAGEKSQLISELVFVAVMQAGNAYSKKIELSYESSPPPDIEITATPTSAIKGYKGLFSTDPQTDEKTTTTVLTNATAATPFWM